MAPKKSPASGPRPRARRVAAKRSDPGATTPQNDDKSRDCEPIEEEREQKTLADEAAMPSVDASAEPESQPEPQSEPQPEPEAAPGDETAEEKEQLPSDEKGEAPNPAPEVGVEVKTLDAAAETDQKTPQETAAQPSGNEGDSNGAEKTAPPTADIESAAKENVGDSTEEGITSKKEGDGPKKVVKKKVVKVVKKVVKKKVPKKVQKDAGECSAEQSVKGEVEDDGGNTKSLVVGGEDAGVGVTGSANLDPKAATSTKGAEKSNDNTAGKSAVKEGKKVDEFQGKGKVKGKELGTGGKRASNDSQDVQNAKKSRGGGREKEGKEDGSEKEVKEGDVEMEGEKNDNIVEKGGSDSRSVVEEAKMDSGDNEGETVLDGGGVEGEKERAQDGEQGGERTEGSDGLVLSGELEVLERRKRRKTEIFLGGLDKDAKEEDVRKIFEKAGEVLEVRLTKNSATGKNRGYGFVRYATAGEAKKALEMFKNVEICGKQCGAAPVEGNDTLYLGNIDKKWKNEDVLKMLHEIGIEKIDKVTVMPDPNNMERNRGFAFLELETCKDAHIAYKKLQKKDALGKLKNVKVDWAEPLSEPDEEEMLKVKSVYVEYIPTSWDEEKLRGYFKKFGEIENIVLARKLPTSRRKDFAFVNYKSREAALACIKSFSHESLSDQGSKVNVKVSLAKPISRGKSTKKGSTAKEISKDKAKASHIGVQSKEHRRMAVSIRNNHEDGQGNRRASTNAELVHLLREQASWRRQSPGRVGTSLTEMEYASSLRRQKRPFSALDDDVHLSNPREYARPRLDSSLPVAGRLSHGSGVASLPYHQWQGGVYARDYGQANYGRPLPREEAPYYARSDLYYKY